MTAHTGSAIVPATVPRLIQVARRSVLATLIVCPLWVTASPAFGQQPAIQYVYDDLNRLIAVIDPQGNVATYAYDGVGNLLKIERFSLSAIPGAVAIAAVLPTQGAVGTSVVIIGKGFSATASQDTVAFSGTAGTVSGATTNSLAISVPAGATSGFITVTTPLGSATSPAPFSVSGAISVSPATATVFVNATQAFTATQGPATPSVTWSVDGIKGGNATVGTISTTGLYTAPATAPSSGTVTVTATSTDNATVSGSATVTISPPRPVFLSATKVTAIFATPFAVNQNLRASVSVIQAPAITAVAPAAGARGATSLLITLSGAGLGGASAVTFTLNNAPDGNITVTNLVASADGTQATATVTIAAGAAPGARVVAITTPAGTSTPLGTAGNVFTVQ